MEQKERERQAANPRSRFRRPHSSRSSKGKRRCGGENKRRREKHRLFGPERMDVREGNFNGATGLSSQWENCSGSLGGARARG